MTGLSLERLQRTLVGPGLKQPQRQAAPPTPVQAAGLGPPTPGDPAGPAGAQNPKGPVATEAVGRKAESSLLGSWCRGPGQQDGGDQARKVTERPRCKSTSTPDGFPKGWVFEKHKRAQAGCPAPEGSPPRGVRGRHAGALITCSDVSRSGHVPGGAVLQPDPPLGLAAHGLRAPATVLLSLPPPKQAPGRRGNTGAQKAGFTL
ncbi:collagen alpha-1(I) chain-like [Talpa occidentalis]|uniref:collagen alpha-1(I) chain-like n=1 Tax=Talpa occidentalis TaxID=50954 RepID=UPI0023F925E4|nr:collagen alpha-1(I) chain-like [Talpa occidentalis]